MMRCAILLIVLSILAVGLSPGLADQPAKPTLDPKLPYQAKRVKPVSFEVDFAAVVTAPYHTRQLKVWLPLPQTDAGQDVEEGSITTFPMTVKPRISTEPLFGNKFAYFEFDHPEGAQIIRHKFKIKVWELRWNVDPAKVSRVDEWPASFKCYLGS